MSGEFFDIVGFKKTRNDKVIGIRLGSAKKRDDGGFYLNFDALPYGQMDVAVVPQRDKAASPKQPGPALPADEIPF